MLAKVYKVIGMDITFSCWKCSVKTATRLIPFLCVLNVTFCTSL